VHLDLRPEITIAALVPNGASVNFPVHCILVRQIPNEKGKLTYAFNACQNNEFQIG
jgi:hypothetical protein